MKRKTWIRGGLVSLLLAMGSMGYSAEAQTLDELMLEHGNTWANNESDGLATVIENTRGGRDKTSGGFIQQTGSHELTINNYSGFSTIIYDHTDGGTEVSDYTAGDTKIMNAEKDSHITISTSNTGIDIEDKANVEKVFTALAKKLWYMGGDENLTAQVQIASGLTASSVGLWLGDMKFVLPDTPDQNYDMAVDGTEASQKYYKDHGVLDDDGNYQFKGNTAIATTDVPMNLTGSTSIDVVRGNLELNTRGSRIILDGIAVGGVNGEDHQKINIKANTLKIDLTNNTGTSAANLGNGARGIYIKAYPSKDIDMSIDGDVEIRAEATWTVSGIVMEKNMSGASDTTGVHLKIGGNLSIYGKQGEYFHPRNNNDSGFFATSKAYGISAASSNSDVTVEGNTTIRIEGVGVDVGNSGNKGSAIVDLAGADISVNKDSLLGSKYSQYVACIDDKGELYINMNGEDKDKLGTNKVALNGNIQLKSGTDTKLHLGLNGKSSYWNGTLKNTFSKADTQIWLVNGALWNNENYTSNVEDAAARVRISQFHGGNSWGEAGILSQRDSNEIRIANYSGYTQVYYDHDEKTPATMIGGDIRIANAATDSHISLITSRDGVDATNQDSVMDALAKKLYYSAYSNGERNLTGHVTIASGLTASSVTEIVNSNAYASGDITFSEDNGQGSYTGAASTLPQRKDMKKAETEGSSGAETKDASTSGENDAGISSSEEAGEKGDLGHGYYVPNTATKGENIPIIGDTETYIMRGVRTAMMTSMLSWRDIAMDTFGQTKAMREDPEADGLWAKMYKGRSTYEGANTWLKNKYNGGQLGFEKTQRGWHTGTAFEYRKGDSDYLLGGYGKDETYVFSAYGLKKFEDGSHLDLAAKVGSLTNTFGVYNEIGQKLKGKYESTGYSLSALYGKRMGNARKYVEPQFQLTWAHIDGSDYGTNTSTDTLRVHQDAVDSIIGRVGIEAGIGNDKGMLFGRMSVAHDFRGEVNGTYMAKDGGQKETSFDIRDVWKELTVGGRMKFKGGHELYADVTRVIGQELDNKWKVDAGVRVFLGSGKIPGTSHAAAKPVAPAASVLTESKPQNVDHTSHVDCDGNLTGTAAMAPAISSAAMTAAKANVEKAEPMHSGPVKTVKERVYVVMDPEVETETYEDESYTTYNDEAVATSYAVPSGAQEGPVFTLAPIVVTANRTQQTILEAKADISVVSRKEIEQMHMETVEDILRVVPGVQFLNYGSNGINANLSGIRINGSKDVVIMIDGVRINDFMGSGSSGYAYTSLLNGLDNIEKVEVLRGGAGVAYGSGAKGGVINIITRKVDGTKTKLDVGAGNFGKELYHLRTEGRAGKFDYSAFFNKDRIGEQKDGSGKPIKGFTTRRSDGVKLGYSFSKDHDISLEWQDFRTKYAGTDVIYHGVKFPDGAPFSGWYRSGMLTLQDNWKINDKWDNKFSLRKTDTKSLYFKPYGEGNNDKEDEPPYSQFSDYTYHFIQEQLHFQSKRHDVLFGFDYSRSKNNQLTARGASGTYGHVWMANYSYYAQDEWHFLPWLSLTAGIRHDSPKVGSGQQEIASHTAKSYKLGADITHKDKIWAGRNDFYIMPAANQLYDGKFGNESLKPATGRTTSIGYSHQFNDNHYFMVNWFETLSDTTVGMDDQGVWQNGKDGVSRGWNAEYSAQIGSHWNVKFGWAHLFEFTGMDKNYSYGYSPRDLATMGVYYNLKKFTAALDGFYFMRRTDIMYHDKEKPDAGPGWPANNYGIYNINLTYSPNKSLTVYLKGDNIFNKLWAEHTDVIWNGKAGSWYAMPGRAISAGVQYTF